MLWNIQNSQCTHSSFNHIHQPSLHSPHHLARNKLAEAAQPWWQENRKILMIAVAAPQNLRRNWPQKVWRGQVMFWHTVLAFMTDHVHASTQNSGSGIVWFWLRTCLGGISCSVHFPCYPQDFGAEVFTTFWTSNLSFSMVFATLWCSNCSCCTVFRN